MSKLLFLLGADCTTGRAWKLVIRQTSTENNGLHKEQREELAHSIALAASNVTKGLLSFHVLGDSIISFLRPKRSRRRPRRSTMTLSRSHGARACGWENRPASVNALTVATAAPGGI
jgi:hypothetical protein